MNWNLFLKKGPNCTMFFGYIVKYLLTHFDSTWHNYLENNADMIVNSKKLHDHNINIKEFSSFEKNIKRNKTLLSKWQKIHES